MTKIRKPADNVSRDLNRILGELENYLGLIHTAWEHEDEPALLAIWVVSTWLIRRYGFTKVCTVYPWITSYQPDCGKTELAKALRRVVIGGVIATPTVAAITRFLTDTNAGSLLIDQFHNIGRAKSTDKDMLNSALANGHTPGTSILLANGNGTNDTRSTFYPKAFFGLAEYQPDLEIRTRTLHIRLHKYSNADQNKLEDRQKDTNPESVGNELNKALNEWSDDISVAERINTAMLTPETRTLKDGKQLVARESDNFRMLIALADMAGGNYPNLIRNAASRMSTGTVDPEPDPTEAERIDGLFLDLMRNGRLPVDNWLKPRISPLFHIAEPIKLRVTNYDLGWNDIGKARKRVIKDLLPMVTLLINEQERKAELRIFARDLRSVIDALGIDRGAFLAAYRNANRLTHNSSPIVFHKGDTPAKIYGIDFTSVVFGKDD